MVSIITCNAFIACYIIYNIKIEEVIRRMEVDALGVLKFMASNGLIANPQKTSLVILNNGKMKPDAKISIKIGKDLVTQEATAKLIILMKCKL